jgi:hypothetical protein
MKNPKNVKLFPNVMKYPSFLPSFLSDPKLKNRQAGFANNDENGEK